MPTCRQCARWTCESDCRELGPWRRLLLRLHLRLCPPCREYAQQIREVGELAREGCGDPCPDRVRRVERSICRELGLPAPAPRDDGRG